MAYAMESRLAGAAHRLVWDGLDGREQPVRSGVYCQRLSKDPVTEQCHLQDCSCSGF